jgi:hypothetical protein
MRFVGGRLTKGRDATLNTPVATIGVRGAIAIAEIQPDRSVIALLVYGDRMSIRSSSDATRVLTQSGLAIDIAANGAIGNPYFPPPALLARLLELLGPTGESTGEQLPIPPPVLLPGRDGGIDLPRLRELLIQSRPTFGY